MNLPLGGDAIHHHVEEFWRLHQFGRSSPCRVHVAGQGAQLLDVLIDFRVRVSEEVLRVVATLDGPNIMPVEEVMD